MSINETDNGNEQEKISPYHMFLVYIRSPKTVKEYTNKIDKFFNFLINTLGETDFKTNDIETQYLLLYTKAKNNLNWFNYILLLFFLNTNKINIVFCINVNVGLVSA